MTNAVAVVLFVAVTAYAGASFAALICAYAAGALVPGDLFAMRSLRGDWAFSGVLAFTGMVALFGLAPRACVAGAWSVLGAVVVIALFGQILRLSGWVTGISPFSHVPKLPGAKRELVIVEKNVNLGDMADPGKDNYSR